jgi:hypothetical protein
MHVGIGIVGGASVAGLAARRVGSDVLVEALGGGFGGWLGARLPDIIDPPLSPCHRSVGHGAGPIAVALRLAAEYIPKWQASLRAHASAQRAAAHGADSQSQRAWHALLELFCLAASGALLGVAFGYLSHVAMDACTPAGIPFVA